MAPIGVIDRNLPSNGDPRASRPEGRRGWKLITGGSSAKPLGVMIVVALATAVFISVAARTPDVSNMPEPSEAGIAIDDYWLVLAGLIYDADGVTPVRGCTVIVTNTNTSESVQAWTSESEAFYQIDLDTLPSNWEYGDIINVSATKGAQIGWNETALDPEVHYQHWPTYFMDVTMSAEISIPEFSSPVVVTGITAAMVAILLASRSRREKNP